MLLRFKSVPVLSSESIRNDGLRSGIQVQSYDMDDVRDHALDIGSAERLIRPSSVAALAFLGTCLLMFLLDALARKAEIHVGSPAEIRYVGLCVAAAVSLAAFLSSVREELKFKMLMKALSDRGVGWRELRIVQLAQWESFRSRLQTPDAIQIPAQSKRLLITPQRPVGQ